MRKIIAAFLPLLLAGCAGLFSSISTYDPESTGSVTKITNRPQYVADLAECKIAAVNYREPISAGSIISGAGIGAAQNSPAAFVGGPGVVAVGAAGGATSAALNGFDILDTDKMIVLGNCLREDSHDDKSFHYIGK